MKTTTKVPPTILLLLVLISFTEQTQFDLVYTTGQYAGILNSTARMSINIDYKTQITCAINFNNEKSFFFDYNKNNYYKIQLNIPVTTTLMEFYKSTSSFRNLIEESEVKAKDVKNMDKEDLKEFGIIYNNNGGTGPTTQETVKQFLELSITLSNFLNGVLKGIFYEDRQTPVTDNVPALVFFEDPLGQLFENIKGGLPQLSNDDFKFDIPNLVSSLSGGNYLLRVLQQLGDKFDLSKILGDVLNTPETLINYLAIFAYKKQVGVDGLLTILDGFLKNQNDESLLEKFKASEEFSSVSENFSKLVHEFYDLGKNQDEKFQNHENLKGYCDFWSNTLSHDLIVNKKNLSRVIEMLGITIE